jgi:radical SAM superfamily enzyme YgiQ (UPF0313 family)
MKISFVYPDLIGTGRDWRGLYNHGVGSLSAMVKQAGHDASLLHIIRPVTRTGFFEFLDRHEPDVIAFSTTSNLFGYTRDLSRLAKEHCEAATIFGGWHPTLVPEEVIEEESIDAICLGEGEHSLLDFMAYVGGQRADPSMKGIWLKQNGRVIKGPSRPIPDLDELPAPDKMLFDYTNLTYGRANAGIFMASRGCPYKCTYCSNLAMMDASDTSEQPFVRFKSVGKMIAEIEEELSRYPNINAVGFDDDILPVRMDWFEEFAKAYIENIHLPLSCCLRPNLATKERLGLLREMGCITVNMGIEAGDDETRNALLKRKLSRGQLLSACETAREAGIKTFAYNMVGLPFEKVDSMLETVKLNAEAKVDMGQCTIFYPYPKTELREICERENLIVRQHRDIKNMFTDTVLDFSWMERNQIRFIQKFFRVLVLAYRGAFSLSEKPRAVGTKLLDAILSSRPAALVVYPAMIQAHRAMMSNAVTNRLGRWILRRVLESRHRV